MKKYLTTLFTLFFFNLTFAHDLFLIQSIPKCGTHFLQKIATELTGKPTFHTPRGSFLDKLKDGKRAAKFCASPFRLIRTLPASSRIKNIR